MNLSQLQKKNLQIISARQQMHLKGGDGEQTSEEEQKSTDIIIVDTDAL